MTPEARPLVLPRQWTLAPASSVLPLMEMGKQSVALLLLLLSQYFLPPRITL